MGGLSGGLSSGSGPGPAGLHRLDAGSMRDQIVATMRDMANDDAPGPRYPGPNPVSLDSSHFPTLRASAYYVCEKTDGVRYALVCCLAADDGGALRKMCVLVDRALTVYALPLRKVPSAMFQGTLLDGELVRNKRSGVWEYLVFDAVCVSGVPVLDSTLVGRMEAVHHALRVYSWDPADPVVLKHKPFFAARRFDEFERHLERVRTEYDIDGVILTPAAPPVTYGRHLQMFKVKFHADQAQHCHTVDFLVAGDGMSLAVFERGVHVTVGHLDRAAAPGAIVECARVRDGVWTMVRTRTDKTTANDMFTYNKTLLNMRERLTVESVKEVFASSFASSSAAPAPPVPHAQPPAP